MKKHKSVFEMEMNAWKQLEVWEKSMESRFKECFYDVDVLDRVDIYIKFDDPAKIILNERKS